MPRPSRPWFRFYVEAVWDRKLRRLTPAQRWLWVVVLAFARQSPRPGVLLVHDTEPVQPADLADASGLSARQVTAAMGRMVGLGMVTVTEAGHWSVTKWSERQYESDVSTERTRKHRSNEQGRNVPTSSPGTHQRTETEDREPLGSAAPPEARPRPQDPLFDALAGACGWPLDELTRDARGRLDAAAAQLLNIGATPDQVAVRAGKFRQVYPNAPLTPQGLTGNWAALANGHASAETVRPSTVLGRGESAAPIWDLDEHGNAIATEESRT